MDVEVEALLRRVAALVVIALACPIALFGGALVGCAASGMSPSCAVNGILASPILLAGAGLGASALTRGWAGIAFIFLGVLLGMITIPVVASLAGNPVPIDPAQGVIATIWFTPPVLIGYGAGRGLARLRARTREPGGHGPV